MSQDGPDELGEVPREVNAEPSRIFGAEKVKESEPTGGFFPGDKEEAAALQRKQEEGKGETVPRLEKRKIKLVVATSAAALLVVVALNLFSSKPKAASEEDANNKEQPTPSSGTNPLRDANAGYANQGELAAAANKSEGSEAAVAEAVLRVHMARDGAQGELALASLSGKGAGLKDAPAGAAGPQKPDPWEQARDQYRMQAASKHYQELLASRNAGLLVAVATSTPGGRVGEREEPQPDGGYGAARAQAQARLDALRDNQTNMVRGMQPMAMQQALGASGGATSGQVEREAFANAAHTQPGVRVAMGQKMAPVGALVSAGTLIELVLETELNSDVPGLVRGRVAAPVWERTGSYVVVPTGSVLVGVFNARVQQGDERVQLAWTRIELPDGVRIELGGQPGTELTGAAGIEADVDRHLDVVLQGALLSTIFSIGAALTAGTTSAFSQSPRQAVAGAAAGEFNETGKQLTRQGWERAPTLRVAPGTHMGIVLKEDLVF
jgi:type IV secretory pathway VirB10-like protein